jgi:hypothetical protein
MQRQSQVLHELKRQSGNTTTVPQLLFHIHNSPTIQQYFSDDQPLNVMDLLTILARLTQSAQGSAISANSLAGNELLTIVLAIHRHYDHIDGAEKATNLLSKALLVRLCAEFCNLCTVDYHETGTSRRIELQQLYSTLIHFYSSVITDSTDRIIPLIESLLESTDARIALRYKIGVSWLLS